MMTMVPPHVSKDDNGRPLSDKITYAYHNVDIKHDPKSKQ